MRLGACLILDFDGTILDTEEPVYLSWSELWEEHGHELVLARWQAVIGTDDTFDPWVELEQLVGSPLAPSLQERRRRRRDELLAPQGPRPGVLDWLEQADELGIPVGIASSSPPDWVEGHLDRLGLRQRFGCLACCDGAVPAKPDPTSYRLACKRLSAAPGRSVAVEDSPADVAAAVDAGLLTIAVPHRLTADLDLSRADRLVTSLDELALADVLEQACRR